MSDILGILSRIKGIVSSGQSALSALTSLAGAAGIANPDQNKRSNTTQPNNEYPNQRVIANEAFKITYGTEKGKQFYQFFGPGGTSYTIYKDGTIDIKNIGEKKEYNKAGVTITVDENQDVHIKGHNKVQVGGGSHVEVAGDAGIVVGGSVAMSMPNGDFGVQAKNIYIGATGNFNLNVEGGMKLSAKGRGVVESAQVFRVGSAAEVDVQAPETNLNKSGKASGYAGPESPGES